MRTLLIASLLTTAATAPALAQVVDRYGGVGSYSAPAASRAPAQAQAAPARVLSWPGKSIPAPAPPQAAVYGQPAYSPAAYPSPLQPQPYYAPAPGAPMPAPGSTATAPSGVYPPNTVPPQFAYPMAVPPQMAQPLVSDPPLPTSIYSSPAAPQRRPGEFGAQAQPPGPGPRPAQMAMSAPPTQGARLYSLHREFGLHPDPTPPAPANDGQGLELVSSIDSGGPPDPAAESGTTIRTRQTDAKGNIFTRAAKVRGGSADN